MKLLSFLLLTFSSFTQIAYCQLDLSVIGNNSNSIAYFSKDLLYSVSQNNQTKSFEYIIDIENNKIYKFSNNHQFDLYKNLGKEDIIHGVQFNESTLDLVIRRYDWFSGNYKYFSYSYNINGSDLSYFETKVKKHKNIDSKSVWPNIKKFGDKEKAFSFKYEKVEHENFILEKKEKHIRVLPKLKIEKSSTSVLYDYGYVKIERKLDKNGKEENEGVFSFDETIINATNKALLTRKFSGIVEIGKKNYSLYTKVAIPNWSIQNLNSEKCFAVISMDSVFNWTDIELYRNNPHEIDSVIFEAEINPKSQKLHDWAELTLPSGHILEMEFHHGTLLWGSTISQIALSGKDYSVRRFDNGFCLLASHQFKESKLYTPLIGDSYYRDVFQVEYYLYNGTNKTYDFSNMTQEVLFCGKSNTMNPGVMKPGEVFKMISFKEIVAEDSEPRLNKTSYLRMPNSDLSRFDVENWDLDQITIHGMTKDEYDHLYEIEGEVEKVEKPVIPKSKEVKQIETTNKKVEPNPNNTGNSELNSIEERLAKIKSLYEKGLITKEEYDEKRKEILENL